MDKQNSSPAEIWDKFQKVNKVIMTLHRSPDGDSLGSSTALKYILEKFCGCSVDLISGDKINLNLPFVDQVDQTKDISDVDLSKYDALVCIDQSSVNMLSSKPKAEFTIPDNIVTINIDHHPTNEYYGQLNYINSKAASACEVLLDLSKEWGVSIDKELATRLLTGITTDTGFYKFIRQAKVFHDAGFLMEQGADYMHDVMEPIINSQTLKNKQFLGLVYSNLKHNLKDNFYYVALSKKQWKDVGLTEDEVGGASSSFADIADANLVFSVIETDEGIKGSFRSRKVDVSKIATALGGGGHKPAAGFLLTDMSIEEAEKKVLSAIEEVGLQPLE